MTRSRAGIILGLLALAGVFLLVTFRPGRKKHRHARTVTAGLIAAVLIVFATLFAAQFSFSSVSSRFSSDPLEDLRVPLARTTFELSLKALPFGTGLGSFISVYAIAEKDHDVFDGYANRAHNDLLEFTLETGIFGLLLLIAFLAWFCRRFYEVWFSPPLNESSEELLLEKGATLIIALLLAHSVVDYPLRTTSLAAIFAFFCAILANKAHLTETLVKSHKSAIKRTFTPRQSATEIAPVEKWGSDLEWPRSWRRKEPLS
jgi:hypothetical protein